MIFLNPQIHHFLTIVLFFEMNENNHQKRQELFQAVKALKENKQNLEYFESRLINIPVGWWLTEEERRHIVGVVNGY